MFREHAGDMEIHTTHNLSRRMNVSKHERCTSYSNDIFITSKVEMTQNYIKGVQ
ncbi:hypothetical protein ACFL20_01550 [Spirochaetota bacterium]